MGLFGFGRKPVSAEIAGRNLTNVMMDADHCWADVCGLRSYKPDGPIATCEVAFARAALTKAILMEDKGQAVAERISRAADAAVLDSFTGQDTDATRAFYGEELKDAAPKRVALYSDNVFPPAQLASTLGAQLGVPGIPSIEAAFIFEKVERQVRSALSKVKIT